MLTKTKMKDLNLKVFLDDDVELHVHIFTSYLQYLF